MNRSAKNYQFSAKPWQHAPPAGWYFVSLPVRLANQVRKAHQQDEEGWGRLRALAKIGGSEWKTAIWYDSKAGTYLLPLKAEIRKKENVLTGKNVEVVLSI
jgi:hypothetical protein